MVKFDIKVSGFDKIEKKIIGSLDKSEHIVAIQAAKDTTPFVPMLTGSLTNRTQVKGGEIIYPGPYARYLYFGKLMVSPSTGSAWAEYGETKVPAEPEKDLEFNRASHALAQAHWFEASKALNMEKWEEIARRAERRELGK